MKNSILIIAACMTLSLTTANAQPTGKQEYVLVVSGASPHADIAKLVAAIRAQPGRFSCGAGHPGNSPGGRAACISFSRLIGVDFNTFPYKSFKDMVGEINAKQVDFGVLPLDEAQTWIASGKLRALAVNSGSSPSPLPGVPTLADAGFR